MNELYHWGVKGQRWGVRRYQNSDGSLTSAGREHYGVGHLKKTLGRYAKGANTVKGIAGKKARFAKDSLKILGQDAKDYASLRAFEAKVMYARPAMRRAKKKLDDFKSTTRRGLFDVNGGVFDINDRRASTALRSAAKRVKNEFAAKSRMTSYYKKKYSPAVQKAAKSFIKKRESQLRFDYYTKKIKAQTDQIARTEALMSKLIDSSMKVSDLMSWEDR